MALRLGTPVDTDVALLPSAWAFHNCWAATYLALLAYAVYQALPRDRRSFEAALLQGVGWWTAASFAVASLWRAAPPPHSPPPPSRADAAEADDALSIPPRRGGIQPFALRVHGPPPNIFSKARRSL